MAMTLVIFSVRNPPTPFEEHTQCVDPSPWHGMKPQTNVKMVNCRQLQNLKKGQITKKATVKIRRMEMKLQTVWKSPTRHRKCFKTSHLSSKTSDDSWSLYPVYKPIPKNSKHTKIHMCIKKNIILRHNCSNNTFIFGYCVYSSFLIWGQMTKGRPQQRGRRGNGRGGKILDIAQMSN